MTEPGHACLAPLGVLRALRALQEPGKTPENPWEPVRGLRDVGIVRKSRNLSKLLKRPWQGTPAWAPSGVLRALSFLEEPGKSIENLDPWENAWELLGKLRKSLNSGTS